MPSKNIWMKPTKHTLTNCTQHFSPSNMTKDGAKTRGKSSTRVEHSSTCYNFNTQEMEATFQKHGEPQCPTLNLKQQKPKPKHPQAPKYITQVFFFFFLLCQNINEHYFLSLSVYQDPGNRCSFGFLKSTLVYFLFSTHVMRYIFWGFPVLPQDFFLLLLG